VAYAHVLVAYDGTSEGDAAVLAADAMARRDGTRVTVVVLVALERPSRLLTRWPRQTGVWNDVLLDRARAELERAAQLLAVPAECTVLFGSPRRALAAGADEFGCDAIMLPSRPRRRVARMLVRDEAPAIRRRSSCAVMRPA
jgi:nucleotide-binding universal stress UspA family protein